ncbi:CHAT domain-containing tetratricopeptide repeat protein [Caenibius tardaugens]|uniref:CHAT domain-containing tetratricopeptide repeat protein n=1 Tax=Caenibius tardaugens TaxID=169176 RepID=UPI001375E165|nr:CHAT domain-containing tetratricopeptide repeat protein [Caenibius tardaugens]
MKAHLAHLKLTQGRFSEAHQLAEEVLAARITQEGTGATGVALARALVSRSLAGQGHLEEALTLAREGIGIHTREDLGRARLLVAEGEALRALGRHQDAQKSFGSAATILLKVRGWNSPETLRAATDMRLEEVRFTGSVTRYNFDLPGSPLLACTAPADSIPEVYKSLIAGATIPFADAKLTCLRNARTFLVRTMGADNPLTLDVSEYLGDALLDAGDSDPAETETRTLFLARQRVHGADHPATRRAAVLYARALIDLGRDAEANDVLASNHTEGVIDIHLLKAARLDAEGQHDHAQSEWEAALRNLKTLPQATIPIMVQTLAGVVINQGLQGHCPNEVKDAVVGLADKIGVDPDNNEFGLQESKAVLLACEGKWEQATALYQILTRQAMRGELVFQGPGKAMILARQAIVLARNPASLEAANKAASEAASIARERRFTPDRDANGAPLGFRRTRVGTGVDPLALAFASQVAVNWADKQYHATRTKQDDRTWIINDAFKAAQDYVLSQAAASLLQSAARAAASDPQIITLVDRQIAAAAQLAKVEQSVIRSAGAAQPGTVQQMEALQAEVAALNTELRTRYPGYMATARPFGLSIPDLRARLRNDEAILVIQPIGMDVYSFAISPKSEAWNKATLGRREMDHLVTVIRCHIDRQNCPIALADENLFDPAAANRLYRELIAPVADGFGQARTLYTVTGGSLGQIPLGILVADYETGKPVSDELADLSSLDWFADHYALATLPSISSLRAFDKRASSATLGFAGIGDPVLGPPLEDLRGGTVPSLSSPNGPQGLAKADDIRKLHSLPGTRRELTAIATNLAATGSELLMGAQARESAIKSWPHLSRARILAFATHAMLPNELGGMAEPGLILTPPPRETAADDGYLSASEIMQIKLNAEWVVLSACNTAGPDGSGESLSGLARAFLFAGARSLLVSHWPVDDKAGAAITSETFRIMTARPDIVRAEAFQLAQKAMRSGNSVLGGRIDGWTREWTDPWIWAPFSLVESGDVEK